jgi:hypothetical protein
MTEGVCKHGAEDDNQPKSEEETDRRKLQIEEHNNLYCSQYIIMRFNSRIGTSFGLL